MDNFTKNISKRLKTTRIAAGYKTAKEFTDKHAIPASTYSQHENAKTLMSIDNIINYAQLISIDPAWLMTMLGAPCIQSHALTVLEERIFEEQEHVGKIGELGVEALPLKHFSLSIYNKSA